VLALAASSALFMSSAPIEIHHLRLFIAGSASHATMVGGVPRQCRVRLDRKRVQNSVQYTPAPRRRTAVRGTEPFLCAGAPLTTGASCTLFSWFARPGDGGPGEPLCPVLTHMASDHGARLTRTAPPSLPRFTHHTGSRACHTDAEPALRGAEQPHVLKLPPAQQLFFAHPHLPPWSRVWTTTS